MDEDDDVAYLLKVDGLSTTFVTTEEVTDAYVQGLGFTRAYPGLRLPTGLQMSIDLRTGVLEGSNASFQIEDIDDTLPQIFGVNLDESEPLLSNVPAGTSALGASLYATCIGTETIGSSGERRRHTCVYGYNVGIEHISEQQASVTSATASPVSATPVTWPGRRFALYRLVKQADGSWPDLTSETERLAARVYWGTLTGLGDPTEKTWTIGVAGPESWLGGTLGTAFEQNPVEVLVGVELDEDANEHVLIGVLDIVHLFDETDPDDDVNAYVYTDPTTNTALLSGAADYDDIATAMNSFLDVLQDDATYGSALSSEGNSSLRYSTSDGEDGIMVRWDRDAFGSIGNAYSLRLRVLAHEKVWKILGYDPPVQNESIDPIDNADKFCLFERPNGTTTAEAQLLTWSLDYPGHWMGTFWAADAVAMKAKLEGKTSSAPEHTNAGGHERWWPPLYKGGTNQFDINATAQLFTVKKFEPLFLSSSKAVPLPADPDDASSAFSIPSVGTVTHQGIVVFEGPFRDQTDPEAEVTKIRIPARVAWRESSDGSVATDSQFPALVIYEWPDPWLYGFEDKRPTLWGSWRVPPNDGEPLTMRSLLVLEHGPGPDVVSYIVARMLASTGAAGAWSAYGLGSGATLTTGPNDVGITGIGDEKLGQYTDAEDGAYALGIPAEMLALGSERGSLEVALERTADDDLHRCKVTAGKVVSARETMRSILAPTGWCISVAGGRYGLFDPFSFEAPELGTGVITNESLAGEPGDPSSAIPEQKLRKWAPIDRAKLNARYNPVTGAHALTETLRSPDQDSWYRAQSIEHTVDGSHLIHPLIPNLKGSNWRPSWLERWRKICRWWSRQHFECSLTVHAARATEFLPGSSVAITNSWLVNAAGAVYGVTQATGFVTSSQLNCEEEAVDITCIVDASTLRLYATAAKATRYIENEGGVGYRLEVEDDYLGVRGQTGTLDVEGFAEPAYSTAGGDASLEVYAFDHTSWTGGIYGTVDSVNAVAGSCYIQLTGALTGATWLRDHEHIVVLREQSSQAAAWPLGVLSPIGDETGVYTGSTKSPPFKD